MGDVWQAGQWRIRKSFKGDGCVNAMNLRILYVAYPVFPVNECSPGGAEQVLRTLEIEAAGEGWTTTIAACSGSEAAGTVFSTLKPGNGRLQSAEPHQREHCRKVRELISVRAAIGRGFDL